MKYSGRYSTREDMFMYVIRKGFWYTSITRPVTNEDITQETTTTPRYASPDIVIVVIVVVIVVVVVVVMIDVVVMIVAVITVSDICRWLYMKR